MNITIIISDFMVSYLFFYVHELSTLVLRWPPNSLTAIPTPPIVYLIMKAMCMYKLMVSGLFLGVFYYHFNTVTNFYLIDSV